MTSKNIVFGIEAREAIRKGVDTLADAVKVTLGPNGRNVIYVSQIGTPAITKDGVTVAKQINLPNRLEDMGAQSVKQVANKTNELAGDGTTTATVLAQAIFKEGNKLITAGANPVELKKGIDKAVDFVIKDIQVQSKKINDNDELRQIATISANGDESIGSYIAHAIEKVGQDGVITVEEAKGMDDEIQIVEGMQFDRGYLSPHFVTHPEKMLVRYENPYILLVEKKVSNLKTLLPIVDKIVRSGNSARPLVIIAEDVEGDALATLVLNKVRGIVHSVAVKSPAFGDRRIAMLSDLAVLVGADVVSEHTGLSLENVTLNNLGTAKTVIITKDTTTIVEGASREDALKERILSIRSQIEQSTSEYDKDRLKERLAKLAAGVALIRVAASTELELKEKRDRIEDAINATRAALEEGIVEGGGMALFRSSLKRPSNMDEYIGDEKLAIDLICKAISEPLRMIARNSGFEPGIIVKELTDRTDVGFDARKGTYVDMFQAGIVDPVKVTRLALQNAASISSLLLTTEAAIVEITKERDDVPGIMQEANKPYGY